MNPMLKLALKGAGAAYTYSRKNNGKKQRELYDSILEAAQKGQLSDALGDLDNANSSELANLVAANVHGRLDHHRAALAGAAADRKARRELVERIEKDNKKGGAGKAIGSLLGVAGVAAAGWAVWEFWLSDKLAENSKSETKTYRPAPARTETAGGAGGTSTLVYSTKTPKAGATTVTNDPNNEMRPDANMRGAAGPLGEAPAERDEELLNSIDEQLTTLDTLDDDQREATAPRHGGSAPADTQSDVLKDTGSGKRSDKVSDADTTIGAAGRHELKKDAEDK